MAATSFFPRPLVAYVLLFVLAALTSNTVAQDQKCTNPVSSCDENRSYFSDDEKITIQYAKHTIPDVKYENTYVDVEIMYDSFAEETSLHKYRFVVCGCPAPSTDPSRRVLYIDPQAVYINESPIVAMLGALDPDLTALKYVTGSGFIYNPKVGELVESGKATDINYNISVLASDAEVSAAIVGSFGVKSYEADSAADDRLPALFAIAESQEKTPLGRAEWVKLVGLFFNKAADANRLFEEISSDYVAIKDKAAEALRRPSVFFNYPRRAGDYDPQQDIDKNYAWSQPDGAQYITEFIRDANADYRLADDTVGGTQDFTISQISSLFGSARYLLNADWFPPTTGATVEDFITYPFPNDGNITDPKLKQAFEKLDAVRCGNVFSRSKRVTSDGFSNDIFESAILRPNLVLADYVNILHPYIKISNNELTYMARYADSEAVGLSCPYTSLLEEPAPDSRYLDYVLVISGLNRFQVQDKLESDVFPALEKRNIDLTKVDVQFRRESTAPNSTDVIVRREVSSGVESDARESTDIVDAFKEALDVDVNQSNVDAVNDGVEVPEVEDTTASADGVSDEGSSGGLSRLAIIAIVIAAVAAAGLLITYCIRRRGSRRSMEPIKALVEADVV